MAISLESISKGARMRAPRIVLLGKPKVGKSTFAASSDNPIFIPIKGEEGIDALDVASFPTCTTFKQVMECIIVLYNGGHEYNTLVIDSISALEPLVWDETCQVNSNVDCIEKVNGGFGKGYVEALKQWRALTDGLDALREKNIASILIGHIKVKPFNDPAGENYDQYQFDINDKASGYLIRWADSVLFASTKNTVSKENIGFNKTVSKGKTVMAGQRFLYTQERPAHPGGGRWPYGNLKYELPLDWGAFTAEVERVNSERNNPKKQGE